MMRLVADNAWDGLESYIKQASRKRVAIAYIGSAAKELLDLKTGDTIVINGSDTSFSAGRVDPAVISGWLADDVEVRSLQSLHAKVMHLEGRKTRVVIGSANASAHSRDSLREAAVLTDDAGLCNQVAEQLDVWHALSERVDQAWLKRACQIYRPPVIVSSPHRPRQSPRLWLGMAINETAALPSQAAALVERLERHGQGSVFPWRMNRGDDGLVRQGDEVVLVDVGAVERKPRKNSRVWPPAAVARVVPDRRTPVAVLVWPRHPDSLETRTFAEVEELVRSSGGNIDWEQPFSPMSPTSVALRGLWAAPASTTADNQ
ncbi:phospholipase D family protein [Micromonospora sp. NPDC000442]|uniref:phospholipase D family protein n=1 Tax=Micromonospora sp. NPDC000442 TaxID=3364217 RepID=UPI003681CB84